MAGKPDFYSQVPKGLAENLAYRLDIRRRAAKDERFRHACIVACRHDILYWMNSFVYLYEPRPRFKNGRQLPMVIPFITWPHQDKFILDIQGVLGREDIGVEKSRGEGASWIAAMLAVHNWLFMPMTAIGFVSKDMSAADDPDDPDSLFWKVDWELTKLPKWMVPQFKRKLAEHTLKNLETGSTISAYAATGDVASGGRKTWFLMDELAKFPRGPDSEAMASTQFVTNSRLIVSTPLGATGAYYEIMHEPSTMTKIVLDWKDNPIRRKGLYRFQDGKPVAMEPDTNPLPEDYNPPSKAVLNRFAFLKARGFKLEDTIRSPWYDGQCARPHATPQSIAQELDRNYGGSMFKLFGSDFLARAEKSVRPPFVTGNLGYNSETLEPDFEKHSNGQLRVWCNLDAYNRPPRALYVVGVDVSTGLAGTYTSNSTIEVFNGQSGEQVAEMASNSIVPVDWADLSMAVSKWFHDAYLIWEINGPGTAVTKRILDKRYANVYMRTVLWKKGKRRKTKEPGWHTNDKTKEIAFSEFSRSVRTGEIIIRSKDLLFEANQYVRADGKITHVAVVSAADDASGEAHGDRIIGACLSIQGIRDRPLMSVSAAAKHDGYRSNTPGGRLKEYEDSLKRASDAWDDRTNWDIMNVGIIR